MISLSVFAQSTYVDVSIGNLPGTMEEFLELRDAISGDPEGGAALFVAAMAVYVENPELGLDMFTVALDRSQLIEKAQGYRGFAPGGSLLSYIRDYLKPRPYLAASYINGTSPENGYTLPSGSLTVTCSQNPHSLQKNGDIKVFVACSGADSPRPIILRRNNRGVWKAVNFNSLFVGIRKPVAVLDDDL